MERGLNFIFLFHIICTTHSHFSFELRLIRFQLRHLEVRPCLISPLEKRYPGSGLLMRMHTNIYFKDLKGKSHMEDLDVDGRLY